MSGFLSLVPDLSVLAALARPVEAQAAQALPHVLPSAADAGGLALGEGAAMLIVLLVGFLPTEIWRSLAVIAGRNLEEGSAVLDWVRAVATALLAAVVARLIFAPSGALLAVPLLVRVGALGAGVVAFVAVRRSIFAGVVVGELVLVVGALMTAP